MRPLTNPSEKARHLARLAMIVCANEGVSLRGWRDEVRIVCGFCGVPEPDDYLAWVSGGKATDATMTPAEWDQAFSLG